MNHNSAGAPGNESRCEDCRKPITRGRRWCKGCWRYHCTPDSHKEETLAELEAKIAERMKPENLPAWWNDKEP